MIMPVQETDEEFPAFGVHTDGQRSEGHNVDYYDNIAIIIGFSARYIIIMPECRCKVTGLLST